MAFLCSEEFLPLLYDIVWHQEIPTSTHIQHIRIWDVSIFSIILRACFACFLVYFNEKLLKMVDILFYAVSCLNLTF